MSSGEAADPKSGLSQSGSAGPSLSPPKRAASLTDLELAFAQDPQSNACAALCEAYLEQNRLMEAMVVAKKGMKANPNAMAARALLARVYLKQDKQPRALQEMDELVRAHENEATAYLHRGKIRLLAGDKTGATADFKKSIDLSPTLEDSKQELLALGITYPEKIAPPPAPPASLSPPGQAWPSTVPQQGIQPLAVAVAMSNVPSPVPFVVATGVAPSTPSAASFSTSSMPPAARLPNRVRPRPMLEGEEALEELAKEVANERPDRGGSARTSVVLLAAGVFIVLVAAIVMVHKKNVAEAIAALSKEGRQLFLEDTYGAYRKASNAFEKILDSYDAKDGATAASLAHTLVVLWGEHADMDRKGALEKTLALAEKVAPDNAHTIAAASLFLLYDGADRQKAARAAFDVASARTAAVRARGEVGSFADLSLGIVDIELGNYSSAADALSLVVQAMPQSVRARVWFGRACHRAGHLDRAESAFSDALRLSKSHPGARAGRALVRVQRGNLNGAAEDLVHFREFATQFPKEISPRDAALAEYAESETYRAAGDEARALGAYENAVRRDPRNADFPYGLGRSLLVQGRTKEALAALKKAVEMEPNRRAFVLALAEAEIDVGDYGAAETKVAALIQQDPQVLGVALVKARLLRAQRKAETESYLREVLAWSKDAPEVNLELGRHFVSVEKKREAREVLEKAVASMDALSPTTRASILLEYGKLIMEDPQDEATALNSFKQAGEWGSLEAWFRAIQLHHRFGKKDRAQMKSACERYLSAGNLPFTAEAKALCAGV